jgi:hypothetical protein
MHRIPNPLRAALAIAAGVFFLFSAASPAAAAPVGYETEALGEDYCTLFSTAGDAEWADIAVEPTVNLTGKAWTSFDPNSRVCLGVEPLARHIEFVAYDAKGNPLDVERIAAPDRDEAYDYAFALTADETASIDFVTVAICRTEPVIGTPSQHCAGTVFLTRPA